MRKKREYEKYGFNSYHQWLFPEIVNFCVIRGKCPCKCVHCPVGLTPFPNRAKKFGDDVTSLVLYEKIVKEMSRYPHTTLRIHAVGEPLLWENLSTALKISKNYGVRTWLFTCLVINDNMLIKNVIDYCDIIEVSVNSRTPDDYVRTKGIDAFELVKYNIQSMKEEKEKRGLKTRILVTRVESGNSNEDQAFIKYWKNKGIDDAFVRTFHNYNDAIKNILDKNVENNLPCIVHWGRFNIDFNGKVVICFNELFKGPQPNSNTIIGDVNLNLIKNIWQNSENLNKIRIAQLKNDYTKIDFTDDLPCISCTSCQPVNGDKPTSENQIKLLKERK